MVTELTRGYEHARKELDFMDKLRTDYDPLRIHDNPKLIKELEELSLGLQGGLLFTAGFMFYTLTHPARVNLLNFGSYVKTNLLIKRAYEERGKELERAYARRGL